jgi:uncharacterized protein (TIGR02300 family)
MWGFAIDSAVPTSQVKHRFSKPLKDPTVAKPELGTKRLCGSCGAKFYDLSKDPIVCPKCGTVFEVVALTSRGRPEPARAVAPVVEAAAPEVEGAEFVSLEEADAEAQGAKAPAADGAEDEEVEIDESLDDAAFIEEQDEGEDDVADIIGDVEDEEET